MLIGCSSCGGWPLFHTVDATTLKPQVSERAEPPVLGLTASAPWLLVICFLGNMGRRTPVGAEDFQTIYGTAAAPPSQFVLLCNPTKSPGGAFQTAFIVSFCHSRRSIVVLLFLAKMKKQKQDLLNLLRESQVKCLKQQLQRR